MYITYKKRLQGKLQLLAYKNVFFILLLKSLFVCWPMGDFWRFRGFIIISYLCKNVNYIWKFGAAKLIRADFVECGEKCHIRNPAVDVHVPYFAVTITICCDWMRCSKAIWEAFQQYRILYHACAVNQFHRFLAYMKYTVLNNKMYAYLQIIIYCKQNEFLLEHGLLVAWEPAELTFRRMSRSTNQNQGFPIVFN
jgi:hypothetical protein